MRAVDTLYRKMDGSRRADFIKVYSWLPRAAYYGIAREAHEVGVPFSGHVPYSASVVEASDAGQRSIEHEDDLMRACSSKDSLMRSQFADTSSLSHQLEGIRPQARILRTTYDPARCRSVIATLALNQLLQHVESALKH